MTEFSKKWQKNEEKWKKWKKWKNDGFGSPATAMIQPKRKVESSVASEGG